MVFSLFMSIIAIWIYITIQASKTFSKLCACKKTENYDWTKFVTIFLKFFINFFSEGEEGMWNIDYCRVEVIISVQRIQGNILKALMNPPCMKIMSQ